MNKLTIEESQHQAKSGDWFKVFRTTKGYVWTPINCFLAVNWRGPFETKELAIKDGHDKWFSIRR